MKSEIERYVQMIYDSPDPEDRKLIASRGFIEIFPFSLVLLYSYSFLNGTIEGVTQMTDKGMRPLEIKENIKNLSFVRQAFRNLQVLYFHGTEFLQISPEKYINMEIYTSSVLIVPIVSNSTVIGYATPCQYNGTQPIDESLLDRLEVYGRGVGRALVSLSLDESSGKLNFREIEVLQRTSWGETAKEIANNLKISEYTVQDYVKSSIKKLNVSNRVQAVAEALRQGIIK